jgi:hypothetical protein
MERAATRHAGHLAEVTRRISPLLAVTALILAPSRAWAEIPFEREPINYLKAQASDPVAKLQGRLERGEAALAYEKRHGYLPAVLKALDIPVSAQVLVFSKTSFQRTRISPATPRAIYFNDDVYVGFVQTGDVLEFSAADPDLGGTFYLLEQTPAAKPAFLRQTHECLQCHASGKTEDVPGHLVRSVFPDEDGQPIFNAGTFTTTDESPFRERWGGWYVTGRHGRQVHMGNAVVTDPKEPEKLAGAAGANVTDLAARLDVSPYLSRHSDIVALMVLQHQTRMHNRITAANFQARLALDYAAAINKALDRPADELSESTLARIKGPAEELVKSLLFVDEAELTDSVEGTSAFAREFAARGPRDPRGRSLREFDLKTRLFRYPCSYLIYSRSFDALPAITKTQVYRRLGEILSGEDQSPAFARRTAQQRQAIREILEATKPDLRKAWQELRP